MDRRRFLTQAGVVGAGIAAAGLTLGGATAAHAQNANQSADTPIENGSIGAYLNAIQELALMAANARVNGNTGGSSTYTGEQLEYFAKVAAAILGIECEHRVLGRVISNTNPANNLAYEQTDGVTAVYNGSSSAVAALTPFLTSTTGPAYSLQGALAGQSAVSLAVTGSLPTYP